MTGPNGKDGEHRIGVYVCHCGSNIAGVVNVYEVAKWAQENLAHQGVVLAKEYKFMCSSLGQKLIEDDIRNEKLDRVVLAAWFPPLSGKDFVGGPARGRR